MPICSSSDGKKCSQVIVGTWKVQPFGLAYALLVLVATRRRWGHFGLYKTAKVARQFWKRPKKPSGPNGRFGRATMAQGQVWSFWTGPCGFSKRPEWGWVAATWPKIRAFQAPRSPSRLVYCSSCSNVRDFVLEINRTSDVTATVPNR